MELGEKYTLTSRVDPGEMLTGAPSKLSTLARFANLRDTEPDELPELLTSTDARNESPMWAGSPEMAIPEPPEELKLVDSLDSAVKLCRIFHDRGASSVLLDSLATGIRISISERKNNPYHVFINV